jgi:hypothetical protein
VKPQGQSKDGEFEEKINGVVIFEDLRSNCGPEHPGRGVFELPDLDRV